MTKNLITKEQAVDTLRDVLKTEHEFSDISSEYYATETMNSLAGNVDPINKFQKDVVESIDLKMIQTVTDNQTGHNADLFDQAVSYARDVYSYDTFTSETYETIRDAMAVDAVAVHLDSQMETYPSVSVEPFVGDVIESESLAQAEKQAEDLFGLSADDFASLESQTSIEK